MATAKADRVAAEKPGQNSSTHRCLLPGTPVGDIWLEFSSWDCAAFTSPVPAAGLTLAEPWDEVPAEWRAAFARYFATGRTEWPEPLDLGDCSDFNRNVYREIRRIPAGETRTYGQLAVRVGVRRGARAVGRACAANRLPIVIPCHRVVGASGLGGYTSPGGLATKRALLALEGALRDA